MPQTYGINYKQDPNNPNASIPTSQFTPSWASGNTINASEITKTSSVPDMSQAPITTGGDLTSLQAQIASITEQANKIQEQIKSGMAGTSKQVGATPPTQETTGEPTSDDILNKLAGQIPTNQMGQTQEDYIKNYFDLQSQVLGQYGLTPESFKRTTELATQIGSLNQQLGRIGQAEEQMVANLQGQPMSAGAMGGREAEIRRNFAIQKSGIASQISALGAEHKLLTGNLEQANKMVQSAIDFGTAQQKQAWDDIKWAYEQQKELGLELSKKEQQIFENAISAAKLDLDQATLEETKRYHDIQTSIDEQKLSLDYQKLAQDTGFDFSALGSLGDAFGRALGGAGFSSEERKYNSQQFANIIQSGDISGALSYIKDIAIQGMGIAAYKDYSSRNIATTNLEKVRGLLNEYTKNGGNTNIFVGTEQNILRKIGTTKNKELANIQARIMNALIEYRRAATGVQFSFKEQEQYEQLFPSAGNIGSVNEALIGALLDTMKSSNNQLIEQRIGSSNTNYLFGNESTGQPPLDVSVLIEQGLSENKSLEEIRKDLSDMFGKDTGYKYLDFYMSNK